MSLPSDVHSERTLQRLSSIQKLSGGTVSVSSCNLENALHVILEDPKCTADDVKRILSLGVSVNKKDDRHRHSPLHVAILNHFNNPSVVIELLNHGADVDLNDRDLNTPLHVAVKSFNGDMTIIKKLLEHKPDVTVLNKCDRTPLHLAVDLNKIDVIEEIVKSSGRIDCRTRDGNSSLIMAVKNNQYKAASKLLELNANPDACNGLWHYPLHYAVLNSNLSLVRLLLKYGAKTLRKSLFFKTPLYIALTVHEPNIGILKKLLVPTFESPNRIVLFDYIIHKPSNYKQQEVNAMLIKYAVLFYPLIDVYFKDFIKVQHLESFVEACGLDISDMRRDRINDMFNLRDFVFQFLRRETYCIQTDMNVLEPILLKIINNNAYPYMADIILDVIKKSFIKDTLKNMDIYTIVDMGQDKVKKVKLDVHTKHLLFSYLTKRDLVALAKVFFEKNKGSLAM